MALFFAFRVDKRLEVNEIRQAGGLIVGGYHLFRLC